MPRISRFLVVIPLIFFCQLAYARVSVKVASTVSRNVDFDPPTVQITLSNIKDLVQGNEKYVGRLTLAIEEIEQADKIPIQSVDSDTDVSSAPYIWIIKTEEQVTPSQGTGGTPLHEAVVTLQLKKSLAAAKKLNEVFEENNNELGLIVDYVDDDTDHTNQPAFPLKRSNSLADEAPTSVRLSGGHLSISARWAVKSSIAYTDGKSAAPGGVILFATESNQGDIIVDGKVFDAAAKEDKETVDCTIDTNAEDGANCVVCEGAAGDKIYIDRSRLPSSVKFSSAGSSVASVTVGGLKDKDSADNPITYIAFMAYEPDGVKRSACYRAIPRRNLTWAELLDGEIEAKEKNPRCFIATAAYGSALHSKVDLFRWFRDKHLMRFSVGRKFVDLYYQYSPPVADYIADRPWLRAMVRGGLWLPAEVLAWTKGE